MATSDGNGSRRRRRGVACAGEPVPPPRLAARVERRWRRLCVRLSECGVRWTLTRRLLDELAEFVTGVDVRVLPLREEREPVVVLRRAHSRAVALRRLTACGSSRRRHGRRRRGRRTAAAAAPRAAPRAGSGRLTYGRGLTLQRSLRPDENKNLMHKERRGVKMRVVRTSHTQSDASTHV